MVTVMVELSVPAEARPLLKVKKLLLKVKKPLLKLKRLLLPKRVKRRLLLPKQRLLHRQRQRQNNVLSRA